MSRDETLVMRQDNEDLILLVLRDVASDYLC